MTPSHIYIYIYIFRHTYILQKGFFSISYRGVCVCVCQFFSCRFFFFWLCKSSSSSSNRTQIIHDAPRTQSTMVTCKPFVTDTPLEHISVPDRIPRIFPRKAIVQVKRDQSIFRKLFHRDTRASVTTAFHTRRYNNNNNNDNNSYDHDDDDEINTIYIYTYVCIDIHHHHLSI